MFEEQQLDPIRHNRKAFSCGEPALDRFLKQQAHQNMRRGVSQTFVLGPPDAPAEIAGIYTWHSQGLGPLLLGFAVQRCLNAKCSVGGYALVVDAKTPAAAAFYAHHGFRSFQDTPRSLYLPL